MENILTLSNANGIRKLAYATANLSWEQERYANEFLLGFISTYVQEDKFREFVQASVLEAQKHTSIRNNKERTETLSGKDAAGGG